MAASREREKLHTELQAERELRKKLNDKVSDQQDRIEIMIQKEEQLKREMAALMQMRNSCVEELKVTNHQLEQNLVMKTRELALANEKAENQWRLINAIDREAEEIDSKVNETRMLLESKEKQAAELESKLNKFLTWDMEVIALMLMML
ncbi:hypothetical protein CBR_g38536 [Chara braunii]|uniref:Uncharacterized protein n=1 Tax=Chara braunii TaxID=69332 RepID=A0A388JP75_CHABU|nr:hypothetical protein CBR_g38536 [Chara braunii]|eukprot:GBG59512.1 hypothetical protein CBR_g38536 [Chara braunii]